MNIKTETATVQTDARAGRVFHNIRDDEFGEMHTFLTPEQARLAAHDLIKAAEEAEGQDA
jgi:hypothetical protein